MCPYTSELAYLRFSHYLKYFFRGRCEKIVIFVFLASLQTPADLAHLQGKHEAVKVLKDYAEVCDEGCLLNFPFTQSVALYLVLITSFLSHNSHQVNIKEPACD